MKVGDLVKLIDEPYQQATRTAKEFGRIGILAEFTCHGKDGPLASGFVHWSGNCDLEIEYAEDLEVISASR